MKTSYQKYFRGALYMKDMNRPAALQEGHRERVKQKFLANGFEGFSDHEILEMLLFYAVPRKDTNEIAHKLINSCGSLSAVFDAPVRMLESCGISENTAVLIRSINEVTKAYLSDKFYNSTKLYSSEFLRQKLITSFMGLHEEHVILALFDSKGFEVFYGFISEGSFSMTEIRCRKIVDIAIKYQATAAVISHNHPSGIARPSAADIESTVFLRKALAAVDIRLLDHIIVADTNSMSFALDSKYVEIFM